MGQLEVHATPEVSGVAEVEPAGAPPAQGRGTPALLARLLGEHGVLLAALQDWAGRLDSTPPGEARSDLESIAAQLRRHAALEEATLFSAMAEVAGAQALAGYEMQHDDIDDVLEELLGAPPGLPAHAKELAGRLLWFCESHFEIEEKHLFPEALSRLRPQRWQALQERAEEPGSL